MRAIRSFFAVTLGVPMVLRAQTPDTLSLLGRSSIAFGVGLIGSREASATAGGTVARASGEAASLSFSHWVRPEIAAEISTAVLGAGATAGFGGGGARVDAITPILFGLSYSPRALALGRSLRPYVSAAAGPYIYSASGVARAGAKASSEAVPGARLGAGANLFVARHFMLAVGGDYNVIGHFRDADPVAAHPDGFGMTLGFGVTWGGR